MAVDFESIKKQFNEADINGKIQMYISAEGLSQSQFVELLRMFPVSELPKLEAALS